MFVAFTLQTSFYSIFVRMKSSFGNINPLFAKRVLSLAIGLIMIVSCRDKNDDNGTNRDDFERYNLTDKTIYKILDSCYLWNETLPEFSNNEARKPDEFFKSLLSPVDKWSFIRDDYDKLNKELEGEPFTMGYSPQFFNYKGKVMMVVEYVYRDSPAEKAGLRRGDIVSKIDGEEMTTDNYGKLYAKQKATYTIGIYNAETGLFDDARQITLEAAAIEADPSVYDTIINVNGKAVGYYVFTKFAYNQKYNEHINSIFDSFREAGVKDLIVDLRYNGGGITWVAQLLASNTAPAEVVEGEEVMSRLVFNDNLTKVRNKNPENFLYRFFDSGHNADMENVYFLCSRGTASASEMLITALMPYMNVKIIGTNTRGKYVGMFVFDRTVPGFTGLGNWAILPITFKIANAEGYTDFDGGLQPNYYVEDDMMSGYQFGDLNDPMLAMAIDVIGGQPLTAKAARQNPFIVIGRDESVSNNNLIINIQNKISE